MKKDSGKI